MKGILASMLVLMMPLSAYALDIQATLQWSQRVEMGMLASGLVKEVAVQAGQKVSKGDVLVRLDDRGLKSQLARAGAQQAYSNVLLDEAVREEARAQDLYDRTLLSDHELNQTLIALAQARAEQKRARAVQVQARLDLEYSVLRAPFAGAVLALRVVAGQLVNNAYGSSPMVVLADTRRWSVHGQVDADTAAALQQGQQVRISVRDRSVDGVLDYIGLEPVNPGGAQGRYAVHAGFDVAPDSRYLAGESAVIHLP